MADNVAITAGSGTSIATDEITGTGEHAQVVKLAIATDGSRTLIPADSGGLLVNLGANNDATVGGDVAHSATDSGNPVKVGHVAIAHGTNPTAVDAAERTNWYANRAGVPFIIGGHPNVITRAAYISDATGPQTDASIIGTIAAGTKVVVTAIAVTCDASNTGDTAVKLGFGATTLPADSATGANGILLDHKNIKPGSGIVIGNGGGILGVGADGEEVRLTCDDPVGGGVSVTFSYYTIES